MVGLLLTFLVVVREVQVWELRPGPLDREKVPEGFQSKPFRSLELTLHYFLFQIF